MADIDYEMLRTGVQVPRVLLEVVWGILDELAMTDYAAFSELVDRCRDSHPQSPWECPRLLEDAGLIDVDGEPHDGVRKIVLAASEGEGLQVHLVDPILRNY